MCNGGEVGGVGRDLRNDAMLGFQFEWRRVVLQIRSNDRKT